MMVNGPLDVPSVDVDAEAAVMKAAGVESWRVPLNWDRMQPDRDGPPDWSAVDRKVLAAARQHISVLALVLGSPSWAAVKPSIPLSPPRDPADYAAFLRAAIARYGPSGSLWSEHPDVPALPVRAWQVWNEPNLSNYFPVQPYQRPYVRLLRAARDAIHGADPGARVVMAGLANFSWRELASLYRAGVKGLFDVAAVHPFSGRPTNSLQITRLNREVMNRAGDHRPIWLTELTWSSAKGKTKNIHGWETTARGQADRLRAAYRLYLRAARSLRLQRIYWYTWASPDRDSPNSFDWSGLRAWRPDGTFVDKPALRAFRAVVRAAR
jgi:hypothetical protein